MLGGARSGKSATAERMLAGHPSVTYVATGPAPTPDDHEWQERVAIHRRRRPVHWQTAETRDLPPLLAGDGEPLLIDCLGTWLTAVMDDTGLWADQPDAAKAVEAEVDNLVAGWRSTTRTVVAISNEVGSGVVPATRSGRMFRDQLGLVNARIAAECDEVLARHRRHTPATAMTAADHPEPSETERGAEGREPTGRGLPGLPGLRGAVTMFTALPVPAGAQLDVDRRSAARSLLWLPAVGAGLGIMAGVPLLATGLLVPGPTGAILGAALAVVTLAVATRGLHLDGLADTVDGLGSSTEANRALEVMRKPDIGAFGVVAVVLLILVKVAALAAATGRGIGAGVAGLIVAELIGRVGVVLAAARGIPSARPEGFGALVAGSVGRPAQAIAVAATIGIAAFPLGWGGQYIAVQLLAAVFVGLAVAVCWRRYVVRRIGGVTGDVFGSVVEVSSAAALVAVAVTG